MQNNSYNLIKAKGLVVFVALYFCWPALVHGGPFDNLDLGKDLKSDTEAIKKVKNVELEADSVNFNQVNNKAEAKGHVVVKAGVETLYADQVELDRANNEALAQGNVFLDAPSQAIDADKIQYNFSQKTGYIENGRVFADPFQIKGPLINKVSEKHFEMAHGYMTTCDHDVPHYRLKMKRMDYYQGDKAVARGITMYLGKVPVMYLPRYTQDLKDEPWFTFVPGYKKDLGYYLLTRTRVFRNKYVKAIMRIDLYERQGIGLGGDYKYRTDDFGSGIFRHYFINERSIEAKHPWLPKTAPSTKNERYKYEWRHKWDIDQQTSAIWQYYRLSDNVLLQKYFEREYRRDPNSDTYFLLTRSTLHGNMSFRWDQRVNRFNAATDRMPEIKYENSGEQLGESGFYIKDATTYSNLVYQAASPTEDRRKTQRLDTNNELYYPTKVAFIQARPFVGGQHTYYSRAIDPARNNVVRGVYRAGMDLSTKFYRMWNYKGDILGMKIDRLRHVVTPTVAYLYQHDPTIPNTVLNQFDSIDSISRVHKFSLGLENKLQTKRGKKSVDLLRALISTDFALKENPSVGGFGPVRADLEFTPNDWLGFKADGEYDHKHDRVSTANFETYINNEDQWYFAVGRRYTRDVDDQLTTEWRYKLNPKWKFKMYDRFLLDSGTLKAQEYTLTRDLHEWELDLRYGQERGSGTEYMIVFRLKAFPEMDLDLLSNSFNQRKAGSQSSEGQ